MQQVGRYQIVGELGRGAMGIVYRALDPAIGRTIAIKTIRLRDLSDDAERERLRERLFREAQSAGILSHPGIVTIYDIAEADGMAYIFMEFVNGPPLEKMLASEQTPDKETILSILRQTAAALDYAHKKGIVHRDIKPANIMIHEDGSAKITDFGVAKIMSQQMTQAGTMMGTPAYMSPEQIQGSGITGRADQFALAVIAYEVLTGEKPFNAEHLPTLLFKVMRDEPLAPQRLNTTLHSQVEGVFRKALAKLPEDRYDTCSEFISSLAAACNLNPEWQPLPRGVSHDLPTVAARAGISTTLVETVITSDATAPPAEVVPPIPAPEPPAPPELAVEPEQPGVKEPPPAIEVPPVWEPRREPPPSHTLRNVFAAIILIALVGAGVYFATKQPAPAVSSEPPVTAAADPAPTPPSPAPVETEPPKPVPVPDPVVQTPPAEIAKASPPPPAPPKDAEFRISAMPSRSLVVFDNDPGNTCTTPCNVTLPAGRHTFTVRSDGYREARRIIEVPADTSATVELTRMTGTLNLMTTPPGLTAIIDGREQARKTPLSVNLPVGQHRVQVVRGPDRQELVVNIADGEFSTQTIEWK